MSRHSSGEQQSVEQEVLNILSKQLNISFEPSPTSWQIQLDGYCSEPLTFVEVWSHTGLSKGGQTTKPMADFCKLLLADKLAGKKGRKVFAVICEDAIRFLNGKTWRKQFTDEFGIDVRHVEIPSKSKNKIITAQERQGSVFKKPVTPAKAGVQHQTAGEPGDGFPPSRE